MQHSTNHNLKLMEATDNVRRQDFVDNFTALDNGISPFYVATESATNTYKVTTGANKTILQNGYSIRVAIPKNSTGAVSITVDSVTVPVKKPNGNAVTNFKQNGVYSLTYYNSVFILASGGVDDVSFSASDLLTGKTANNSNGEKVNGTMPNKGAVTASLNCGGSYTIPAGYHNGSGKVTANGLSSQTSATAAAGDILKDKTAWVNGNKITGTISNQGSITPGNSITQSGDKIYCRMPKGAYLTNASSGYPEISYLQGDVATALGLTANKIVAGNTIGGIAGTATIQSLGGLNYQKLNLTSKGDYTLPIVYSSGFVIAFYSSYVAYTFKLDTNNSSNIRASDNYSVGQAYTNTGDGLLHLRLTEGSSNFKWSNSQLYYINLG